MTAMRLFLNSTLSRTLITSKWESLKFSFAYVYIVYYQTLLRPEHLAASSFHIELLCALQPLYCLLAPAAGAAALGGGDPAVHVRITLSKPRVRQETAQG